MYAQNFSAVSGACMMMRREVFHEIGGFDEEFQVLYYDVDLCLRLRKAGYLVLWTPFAELYLYEAKNVAVDKKTESKEDMETECRLFYNRWSEQIKEGDPYYNPNLPVIGEDFFAIM